MFIEILFASVCVGSYAFIDRLTKKIAELDTEVHSIRNDINGLRKIKCAMCTEYFIPLHATLSRFCDECSEFS